MSLERVALRTLQPDDDGMMAALVYQLHDHSDREFAPIEEATP